MRSRLERMDSVSMVPVINQEHGADLISSNLNLGSEISERFDHHAQHRVVFKIKVCRSI